MGSIRSIRSTLALVVPLLGVQDKTWTGRLAVSILCLSHDLSKVLFFSVLSGVSMFYLRHDVPSELAL